MRNMNIKDAINHFGSKAAIGRALGIGRASVQGWRGDIPIDRQCQLEIVSGGVLKADRHRLFPLKNTVVSGASHESA